MVHHQTLEELITVLPFSLRHEVEDFVQFLLAKRVKSGGTTLRQDWGGALQAHRAQYTSLELQKKALEWRGD